MPYKDPLEDKLRRKRMKAVLRDVRNNAKCKPCFDCGVQYPPHVMQFAHHVGSHRTAAFSVKALLLELSECEVVCANCCAARIMSKNKAHLLRQKVINVKPGSNRDQVNYTLWRRKRNALNVELIDGGKNKPCSDCGVQYPPHVMQYDHVNGAKRFTIGKVRNMTYGLETIRSEIAKCDIVCANCHVQRTHERSTERIACV